MVLTTKTSSTRLVSFKKEATLLFLAVFYFVIATNTQTGWLFVLSAFMLGVLAVSWSLSRRSIKDLDLGLRLLAEPQRGRPLRTELALINRAKRSVFEVRVDAVCPDWARTQPTFQWAVPKLDAGEKVNCSFSVVPDRRGEHRIPPIKIVCGAPFGLFTVSQTVTPTTSFLVYPELEKLPLLKSRSRAATALGELTSPTGRGDTHSLRSVREYQPGDDQRLVHWKASAKRGPGTPLLVREHHAPAPNRILLFLDTSAPPDQVAFYPPFERAVVFAASVLWSATRDGTQAGLVLKERSGNWKVLCHWPEQYRALAGVASEPGLTFSEWVREAGDVFHRGLPKGFRSCRPAVVKGASPEQTVESWPDWPQRIFLVQNEDPKVALPPSPKLVRLNASAEGFQDV